MLPLFPSKNSCDDGCDGGWRALAVFHVVFGPVSIPSLGTWFLEFPPVWTRFRSSFSWLIMAADPSSGWNHSPPSQFALRVWNWAGEYFPFAQFSVAPFPLKEPVAWKELLSR